jgi:hypothetical protein
VSIYSVRLFAGQLGTVDATLYTVPTNNTVVVRDVEMYNFSNASVSFAFSASVSGTTQHWLQHVTGTAVQTDQWTGRVVLESGDLLIGHCTSTSNYCYISGYLLS